MLLDIIIPQYSENEEVIRNLLNSINNQNNVDFSQIKITIVNDFSNVILNDKFLHSFNNLDINYIRNDKNTGPGPARQKGFDNTNGLYVMYCDSDDELYDLNSLWVIMDFITKYEPDYLVSNIAIENEFGEYEIKKNKDTFPWMHGKVYKRQFLVDNEIRFHDDIRHVEDGYYTTCVLGVIDKEKIKYLDYATYKWKNNTSSLTRSKNKYNYVVNTFDEFIKSPKYTYDFLVKKNSKIKYNYIISALFGIYIALNSNVFDYKEL
ncbi:MAG: glycosyltransferase, partial [Acholeplasmatales bacterium]|nr:glycosyltransferase [Acholeplasmatales bacterium]